MKKLVLFLTAIMFLGISFTSCEKEDLPEPIPITQTDTSNWYDDYIDGGTIPTNTNSNPLKDTKWILTHWVSGGFVHSYPNDTIEFVSNTTYKLNGGAERTFFLSGITGSTNKTLTLNFFASFGGSNYAGVVGAYFIDDGFMNNIEFTDMQNSSIKIRAWFEKQ
jgi:hypothetical protein